MFLLDPFRGSILYMEIPSVCLSVITSYLTDISVTVAQIQKIQKTRCIFFDFFFWEDPPHLVNWSLTHSTGPQTLFLQISWYWSLKSQKIKKQVAFYFEFCFWEDPPHPVNWSPNEQNHLADLSNPI